MKTLLLIDFTNTLIRSLAVNKALNYEGQWTGGLYGVFDQLVGCIHRHHPTHVIACEDHKPYLREKLYPGYKGDRKNRKYNNDAVPGFDWVEAMKQSKAFLQRLFEILHIPFWSVEGLEADDLIAIVADTYGEEYDRIIILSNDTDLNQLLQFGHVFIYKKSKYARDDKLYGLEEYAKEFPNVAADDWIYYTAMVGTHNGVPGIKGIGPKTAVKILADTGIYDQFFAKHEKDYVAKLDLIQLPFPAYTEELRVPAPTAITTNSRPVARYLESHGIQFTTRMLEAIENF